MNWVSTMFKILLVEDDEIITKGLKYMLMQENYLVDASSTLKNTFEMLNQNNYDLIILDISLPDGNGIDLGRKIKEDCNTAIIFLTANDSEETIVEGLKLGADDYITKPFRSKELLIRIKNILKRQEKNKIITVNNIKMDLDKALVYVGEQKINLTSLEYKILSLLFLNLNKIVTRDVILDKIWDMEGRFVNDNTLSVYIKRIRKKLNNEDVIKTIKGLGYRVDSDE